MEVIGEAVKRIPEDMRKTYPSLAWHPVAAMRDFLIHEYPDIDAEAVWNTVIDDFPPFKKGIQEMLEGRKKCGYDDIENLPFILEVPGFNDTGPDKKNMDILKSFVK